MTLTANVIGYGSDIIAVSYTRDSETIKYKKYANLVVWTSDFFVFLFVNVQVFHNIRASFNDEKIDLSKL